MIIEPGSLSQSLDVQIVDDAGLAVTGLIASTFPAVKWSLAGNTAAVAITLSDLAAITTAWTAGGVKERSGGFYRLDLPNAALATAGTVTLIGDATGKHLLAEPIVVATPATLAAIGASSLTSLILSLEIRVGGILTDADAPPTLADPTAAFGVRRADTLAVLVAAGKAFTHDGTGLYSYSLNGSDADHPLALAGVTYEYWPHFTVAGTPLNYQQTKTAAAAGATGYYSNQLLGKRMRGSTNTLVYSDLEATGIEDTANEQFWITKADELVDLEAALVGRPHPVPTTEPDFGMLQLSATKWWVGQMEQSRGTDPDKDLFRQQIIDAVKEIQDLMNRWSETQSDSAAVSTAGAITAVVGAPKQYPGTGSVRPPTLTVPSLTGDVSW